MSRVATKLALLVAVAVVAVPAAALASPGAVIRDCAEDGDLDRSYSNSDLDKAEQNLPSDLDEYSDCREVIAGAKSSGSDRGGQGRAAGRAPDASVEDEVRAARAEDRAELERASRPPGGKPKLRIGGKTVEPGENGLFNTASAVNDMPLPLLLALIALALTALGGGLWALRRRIPALARISLPNVSLPRFRK